MPFRSLNRLRWNSQIIHFICLGHVAKVKATTSAHSMATPFSVFIILFESNAKTKRNIYSTKQSQYLWHCPCIYVSTSFGDLWSKHYRLRDSKLAGGSLRLSIHTKNKPRVDYEPRSAHGRAVKDVRANCFCASLRRMKILATSCMSGRALSNKRNKW